MAGLEDRVTIANPNQPHCACVLLLDTSGSMDGPPIKELNDGLRVLWEDIAKDDLAAARVDLAIVKFGGAVSVERDFGPVTGDAAPTLAAEGDTPMGEAILKAIEMVEQRKVGYKSGGIPYYRPWILMFTDGAPTDMVPGDADWNRAAQGLQEGERAKKFLFFAFGTEGAAFDDLKSLTGQGGRVAKLRPVPGAFREMFKWLSASQQAVSRSKAGDAVALPPMNSFAEVVV